MHIGRDWSGTITVKRDHELVKSGPYRLVRHPIYSGLLLAFIDSALARGEWPPWSPGALAAGSEPFQRRPWRSGTKDILERDSALDVRSRPGADVGVPPRRCPLSCGPMTSRFV
jgi:hypothetical protein